jgi:hypothetical protein
MLISALEMLRHGHSRSWGLIALILVSTKGAWELWSGHALLQFMHMDLCGRPLPASHAGGIIGGMAAFLAIQALSVFSRHDLK